MFNYRFHGWRRQINFSPKIPDRDSFLCDDFSSDTRQMKQTDGAYYHLKRAGVIGEQLWSLFWFPQFLS